MNRYRYRSDKTGEIIGFDDDIHHYAGVDEESISCHPYHDPTRPCTSACTRRIYVPFPKEGYPWTRIENEMGPDEFKKFLISMAHRMNNPPPDYKLVICNTRGSLHGKEVYAPCGEVDPSYNALECHIDEIDTRLAKAYANWIIGPLKTLSSDGKMPIDSARLRELANIVELTDMISFSVAAKEVLPEMISSGEDAWTCIHRLGLVQTNDEDDIRKNAMDVMDKFPDKIAEYRNGKKSLLGMFVGELMRSSDPKPNPKLANEVIRKLLEQT